MPVLRTISATSGELRNLTNAAPAFWLFSASRDTCYINRNFLNLRRNWTNDIDSLDRLQLANLLKTQLGFAIRDNSTDRICQNHCALGLHLFRDAKLVIQNRRNVHATHAVGISNRLGPLERLLE